MGNDTFAAASPASPASRERRLSRGEAIALILLAATALGVRIYLLRFHDLISADGTGYVGAARALARGDASPLAAYGFYPVLVWLASLAGPDMESAGRLVSIFSGSLLVVPLYLLGREIFSSRSALAACIVTAVWPSLLNWSCEVMTQATYTLLAVTGIYLVRRLVTCPSTAGGCAAGICLGLAYLTRTEAFLLFVLLPLFPLVQHRRELRRVLRPLGAYCVCFALLLGINVLLVRHVTGEWQLAAKTSVALNDALSAYLEVNDLGYLPEFGSTSYLSLLKNYPDFIRANTLHNLKDTLEGLVPLPIWLLCLGGFLSGGFGREKNAARLFLLATFSPLLVIIVFYYVGPEYTQPYLPGLLLWGGAGLERIERFLTGQVPGHAATGWRTLAARFPLAQAAALLFASTMLVRQLPASPSPAAYRPADDQGRRDQKNIGVLLKKNLPPGKIMTRWGRIAYYAEREWTTIPQAGLDEVIRSARQQEVRFLVIDGYLFTNRPQLEPLLEPLTFGQDSYFFVSDGDTTLRRCGMKVRLLYLDPSSSGVAVYEIGS